MWRSRDDLLRRRNLLAFEDAAARLVDDTVYEGKNGQKIASKRFEGFHAGNAIGYDVRCIADFLGRSDEIAVGLVQID